MRQILLVSLLLFLTLLCFGQVQGSTKQQSIPYKAGQVWKFDDLGSNDPTITILKVESRPKVGTVIHVRIDKIPAADCGSVHLTTSIEHLALTESALRKSTHELVQENVQLSDTDFEAYRQWEKEKKPKILKSPLHDVVVRNPSVGICNVLPVQTT